MSLRSFVVMLCWSLIKVIRLKMTGNIIPDNDTDNTNDTSYTGDIDDSNINTNTDYLNISK